MHAPLTVKSALLLSWKQPILVALSFSLQAHGSYSRPRSGDLAEQGDGGEGRILGRGGRAANQVQEWMAGTGSGWDTICSKSFISELSRSSHLPIHYLKKWAGNSDLVKHFETHSPWQDLDLDSHTYVLYPYSGGSKQGEKLEKHSRYNAHGRGYYPVPRMRTKRWWGKKQFESRPQIAFTWFFSTPKISDHAIRCPEYRDTLLKSTGMRKVPSCFWWDFYVYKVSLVELTIKNKYVLYSRRKPTRRNF